MTPVLNEIMWTNYPYLSGLFHSYWEDYEDDNDDYKDTDDNDMQWHWKFNEARC